MKPGEKCDICGEVHEPASGEERQPTDAGGPVDFSKPLQQ